MSLHDFAARTKRRGEKPGNCRRPRLSRQRLRPDG